MSPLEEWLSNGWLKRHQASAEEVGNLLALVRARLSDAKEMAASNRISLDLQLTTLFIAARTLAEIALRVSGFRAAARARHHELTIASLSHTLGPDWTPTQRLFDVIRRERIIVEYESVGRATRQQITELTTAVDQLLPVVAEFARRRGFAD